MRDRWLIASAGKMTVSGSNDVFTCHASHDTAAPVMTLDTATALSVKVPIAV
jgi:hypothetical protein